MNQEVYAITKKAIDNDEVDILLKDAKKYDCSSLHQLPIPIPKDWTQIIEAIYIIFNENPSCNAQSKYLKAFYNLANGEPEEVWLVTRVLLCQYVFDKRVGLDHIFGEEEVKYLGGKLLQNKEKLCRSKKWMADKDGGLWADVETVDKRLFEDFSIKLI